MPISEKQLAANRANAKKSTGPRTPKGKAVCAVNGFQHSFIHPCVQRLTGPLYGGLSLKPVGEVELQLARTIALDNFRLNRLKAFEENMLAYGELGPTGDKIEAEHARVHHALTQSQVFVMNQSSFNNFSLYDQRITRNIHKNLKLLRQEQALRKAEELLDVKAKPLTRTVSITSEENGFGFSNTFSQVKEAPDALGGNEKGPLAPGHAA